MLGSWVPFSNRGLTSEDTEVDSYWQNHVAVAGIRLDYDNMPRTWVDDASERLTREGTALRQKEANIRSGLLNPVTGETPLNFGVSRPLEGWNSPFQTEQPVLTTPPRNLPSLPSLRGDEEMPSPGKKIRFDTLPPITMEQGPDYHSPPPSSSVATIKMEQGPDYHSPPPSIDTIVMSRGPDYHSPPPSTTVASSLPSIPETPPRVPVKPPLPQGVTIPQEALPPIRVLRGPEYHSEPETDSDVSQVPPFIRVVNDDDSDASGSVGVIIATVAAGVNWRKWSFVALAVGIIIFTTYDMSTLPPDPDSEGYGEGIIRFSKGVLQGLYKAGTQLAHDVYNINSADVMEFQAFSLIISSLIFTWGFMERQLVAMMNTPGNFVTFHGVGYYTLRPIRNLAAGTTAMWGRALIITPAVMYKFWQYWKSPHQSRWLVGNEYIPQITNNQTLTVDKNTSILWNKAMHSAIVIGGDASLASLELLTTLNGHYSHYMLATLLNLVFLRPYSYGLLDYSYRVHTTMRGEMIHLAKRKGSIRDSMVKARRQVELEYYNVFWPSVTHISQQSLPNVAPTLSPATF